jgi:hypothetical protein
MNWRRAFGLHEHRYVEVGREYLTRRHYPALRLGSLEPFDSPVTLITERCSDTRCRKWYQLALHGWVGHAAETGAAKEP